MSNVVGFRKPERTAEAVSSPPIAVVVVHEDGSFHFGQTQFAPESLDLDWLVARLYEAIAEIESGGTAA